MCVLDLSKLLMYDFFYNSLRQLFPSAQLLFTDTDSLCVSIEGRNDIYRDIRDGVVELNASGDSIDAAHLFDFSNYPPDHPCYSKDFKAVPGKMKDELGANVLLEFIGLRPKAYAFKKLILYPDEDEDEEIGDIVEVKKLKGIQKCEVKKNINFDHYKSCLFEEKTHLSTNIYFQSHLHVIRTMRIRKIAMTPYDDKRYLLDDGITSFPHGYDTVSS